MENTEKQMSYQQSLDVIQSMIDTARHKVAEDGFHLILWGILVILCSLLNYGLIKAGYYNIAALPWIVMPFVGVPIGIYYERQLKKEGHAKTHIEMHIAYMWWSYGITLFLAISYSVSVGVSPIPFILMITGLVTFASGLMLRFKPLIAGGIVFWVLTVVCFWVVSMDQLLIEALGVLLGYIVPGILMRREAKAQSNV